MREARANWDADPGIDRFVEEVGVFFEANGLPRAAGRMLGWLLVCDPPEQSAEELAVALSASSGGVSQSARLLVQARYVERVGVSGDRRAHYRIRPHAWTQILASGETSMRRLREIAETGLEVLDGAEPARSERLIEMRELFAFVEHEYPALMRRYERPERTLT